MVKFVAGKFEGARLTQTVSSTFQLSRTEKGRTLAERARLGFLENTETMQKCHENKQYTKCQFYVGR